jgi:hypothetical protein
MGICGNLTRFAVVTVALLSWSAGCEDPKPKKTPTSVLGTCYTAWSFVTLLNDDFQDMPRSMVWSEGQLYQATDRAVVAMPAEGGPVTTLVPDAFANTIWSEGDDLTYSTLTQLLRVPRAGGVAVPLLDIPRLDDQYRASGGGLRYASALDQDAYYWINVSTHGESVYLWRASRATGSVEQVATIPLRILETDMALTPTGILVAGTAAIKEEYRLDAYLVPLNGDSPRPFKTEEPIHSVVSMDSTGMVWNSPAADEGNWRWFSPLDGSPRKVLSHELPDFFIPTWSAPDGQGGRYLAGDELFDNNTTHGSAFHVDENGSAKRLACNPLNDWFFVESWAMAPDAIYFTTGDWLNGASSGWRIFRIPR